MSRPILFALLTIVTLGVISLFVIPDRIPARLDQTATGDSRQQTTISYDVPNRPAFDQNKLPDTVYEAICLYGHPIFITSWDLDPDTRFVIFKGPFKDYSKPNARVYPYVYLALNSLQTEKYSTALYFDSLDHYLDGIIPADRSQFLIPRFSGIPDRLNKLIKLLGKWDVEYEKKDPDRLRIIYDKKMCLGEKLIIGAYFDIVENRVVNTKGMTNPEKLRWVMENRTKPKPDKKPLRYTENIPAEGTAKHVVTQLVLLRTAGKQSEALALVSKNQTGEFIRNELTKQAYPDTSIDLDSFTYQATKYTRDSAYITVMYYYKNGTLTEMKHKVILENGHWKIYY